ncbi:phosphoadenosine phosphosulfate reductase [Buchnera aphidicola str. Ak (Acyrthosiphon kondoi)]|uniref:Phosphoadenosine 5'-phosphosulfate reductase n=1 Tax=Buchnera aphidicola str. Ak (Acyrthosiphon kondoi) TaxID=1005090 RepID=G2LNC6_9GAMM|nr:phosphoadenylyl-sulfate reductase [Buchnera aphidicola]AEO08764.1 phosphoadenosine phosphosulfate reductase [Buchnera aphidicola str. Ak (Acyrthosiphon kondoi)]WAI18432.1 MAG: phosphoadenylyl-sulfate reductase [Buchnera aphidicola (Acyrthosiphon caraganae)]
MSIFHSKNIDLLNSEKKNKILSEYNLLMSNYSAEERITWALKNLPHTHIMSSSFGIQSIVLLHLITKQKSDIPVVLIDTGYLFPETYNFIDTLTDKFNLNLKIFRSKISPAWQEARYGKLWEKGIKGINFYNNINKVQPMNCAIHELSAQTWFAGLRHDQSKSRNSLSYLSIQKKIFKILPILDWSNNKIKNYLQENNLDIHPLYQNGYSSVGDIHTTVKHMPGMLEEDTRFFGLKRECGLHEN